MTRNLLIKIVCLVFLIPTEINKTKSLNIAPFFLLTASITPRTYIGHLDDWVGRKC